MRRLLLVVLVSLFLPLFNLQPASADDCPEWDPFCQLDTEGDQEGGSVVTEGVQFPGVDGDSALGRATAGAADCPECEWTISPACQDNGPGEMAVCLGATISCAEAADVQYRVYLRRDAAAPWELVDTVCLGPDERPTSVADVGQIVRERVLSLLPDASPSFQPVQGGVVNLPTIFAAGEPGSMRTGEFAVLGFGVVVTATARWEWTFEEDVTEVFTEPGGAYPDRSVAYTYADAGAREVSVTTYWKASFTVDGDGPFAVPGAEITKTAGPLAVPVRQARSQLVVG